MKRLKLLTIILIALLTVWTFAVTAFAYDKETVQIQVKANEAMTLSIENKDGTPYETMKIDGQGTIDFSYDEPGSYEYRVKQVYDEKDTSKTYDNREWYISLFVSDAEEEGMTPIIAISDLTTGEKSDFIEFNNQKVIPPVKPEVKPQTGDTISSKLFGMIAIIAAGIALILYVIYKITKNNNQTTYLQ